MLHNGTAGILLSLEVHPTTKEKKETSTLPGVITRTYVPITRASYPQATSAHLRFSPTHMLTGVRCSNQAQCQMFCQSQQVHYIDAEHEASFHVTVQMKLMPVWASEIWNMGCYSVCHELARRDQVAFIHEPQQ